MTGNQTLTLAMIWQLMRAYTLSLLSQLNTDGTPIVESEIISWANNKLEEGGKENNIKHFQDKVELPLHILVILTILFRVSRQPSLSSILLMLFTLGL